MTWGDHLDLPAMARLRRSVKEATKTQLRRAGFDLTRTVPTRFLRDAPTNIPAFQSDQKRLKQLRARYKTANPDIVARSVWQDSHVEAHTYVESLRFRAESMFVWQYVNAAATSRMRQAEYQYHVYLSYLETIDERGLLDLVEEDGAFGAPMFEYPGRAPVSRDLLDSVNEILYLHRQIGILDNPSLRVLDIGAGYGRLAHRMTQLVEGLDEYVCVDAVPESTYVCERYLDFRGVRPPCHVVELPDVEAEVVPGRFDVAVNVHSFSEMPASAIRYWLDLLAGAGVSHLFVIPNAPTKIASYEPDGRRIDMGPYFQEVGYELIDVRPFIEDPAAREMFEVNDHFHLFAFTG